MDFRVTPGDHVAQDFCEGARIEPIAVDALTHARQRVDRGCMADPDRVTVGKAKPLPGGFGEADFVEGD